MFSPDFNHVVLIEKNKPEWMAGHLNGVGGKVEAGESSVEAMVREFREEAALETTPERWIRVCALHEPGVTVDVFACVNAHYGKAEPRTAEPLVTLDPYYVGLRKAMPNLRWLVPMSIWALKKPYHSTIDMIGGLS